MKMIIIYILVITFLAIIASLGTTLYTVHLFMVRDEVRKRGRSRIINWFTFYKIFRQKDWRWSVDFPSSFFESWSIIYNRPISKLEENEIHASIIILDNEGCYLDPISFLIFSIWLIRMKKFLMKHFNQYRFNDNFIINLKENKFQLEEKNMGMN